MSTSIQFQPKTDCRHYYPRGHHNGQPVNHSGIYPVFALRQIHLVFLQRGHLLKAFKYDININLHLNCDRAPAGECRGVGGVVRHPLKQPREFERYLIVQIEIIKKIQV